MKADTGKLLASWIVVRSKYSSQVGTSVFHEFVSKFNPFLHILCPGVPILVAAGVIGSQEICQVLFPTLLGT